MRVRKKPKERIKSKMALFAWRKIEHSGALETWERKRGWLDVALCLTETQQPKHTDCNMIHSRVVTELHTSVPRTQTWVTARCLVKGLLAEALNFDWMKKKESEPSRLGQGEKGERGWEAGKNLVSQEEFWVFLLWLNEEQVQSKREVWFWSRVKHKLQNPGMVFKWLKSRKI